MSNPIDRTPDDSTLITKLRMPPARAGRILRPRLTARLNEGLTRPLVLISATAGAGKTTLLTEWQLTLKRDQAALAWLSLDEHDNDLKRFWKYLIAALQTIEPGLGANARLSLDSISLPGIAFAQDERAWTESLLTSLINDLALFPTDVVLTLDDYHSIASPNIHDSVAFFLGHLPENTHLIIASREDPPLPLARLRARDQLVELRSADLHFTPDEATAFFHDVMKLSLTQQDCSAIETRTEGWVAGLQMAALALRGQRDPARFIASFTGSHHFVMDYLIGEVLRRQSPDVQAFLLQTSVLERLNAALCDEITQRSGSQVILERLDAANLFVVSLDAERRWYRYHHLFAELLRNRLTRTSPDQIAELHRRASDWYARNGLPHEAVAHALEVRDWQRAAELIEGNSRSMWLRGEIGILRAWLELFPAGLLLERIELGLVYAWTLTMANQLDRAEQHLDQLTPLVQGTAALHGELLAVRVLIAVNRSNMPAVITHAQQSLSLLPPEELFARSIVTLSLGVAYNDTGDDSAAARRAFREAYELGKATALGSASGKDPSVLIALAYLAELEWLQGNFRGAIPMYEQALQLAGKWEWQVSLARVQWGRASLFYEWNDLDSAERALQESIRFGELWKNPRVLVHGYGLSALTMQARGQTEDARAMLRRAEHVTRDSYAPLHTLGALACYQIAFWTAQVDFQAIARWEQRHDTAWQAQTGQARDLLATVLARARIARHYRQRDASALREARALIGPALERSQARGFVYHAARLFSLDALALYAQGETVSALAALKRALTPAEPENYVRSFLDLGKPMEEILLWSLESRSLSEPALRAYAGKLLSHFGIDYPMVSPPPARDSLVEPLTERELDVLRLAAAGATDQEIADQLIVSKATVKTHLRNIYGKLQAKNRTQALVKARVLRLLG